MGSYGNLARRAVETEMPIMVKVIKKFFLYVFQLVFGLMIWNLRMCFLCFQMQELLRGAKNAVSLAQVCFSILFFFQCLFC
jgi:hypothetical protein